MTQDFELSTEFFRVARRDGSLWVEYLDGVAGDGAVLVPDRDLADLIAALNTARELIAA